MDKRGFQSKTTYPDDIRQPLVILRPYKVARRDNERQIQRTQVCFPLVSSKLLSATDVRGTVRLEAEMLRIPWRPSPAIRTSREEHRKVPWKRRQSIAL